MTGDELATASAVELVKQYRRRAVSPVEVVENLLAGCLALNPKLNALVLVDEELALEQARAAQDRYRRGNPRGPLDGVPVSIKDVLLTSRWPTRRGSASLPPASPAQVDAPSTARLLEGGAVTFGKTTTPELGWKAVTDGPAGPPTRNPWNLELTTGGSSGGAAACVAAGLGPIAMGSDGGGSIRIPAAFCGVAGLKASYGRIPVWPPSLFGDVSHAGPLARTVDDLVAALHVLEAPDERDRTFPAHLYPSVSYDLPPRSLQGVRVGVLNPLPSVTDPQVAAVFGDTVAILRDAGSVVSEVRVSLDGVVDSFKTLWFSALARFVDELSVETIGGMDPQLVECARAGRGMSAIERQSATERRARLCRDAALVFDDVDVLVMPTVPICAFEAGRDVPDTSGMQWWPDWTPLTVPFNLTGQPAVSVPAGFDHAGRPIGLQLVGRFGDDANLLAIARSYELARGSLPPPPIRRLQP